MASSKTHTAINLACIADAAFVLGMNVAANRILEAAYDVTDGEPQPDIDEIIAHVRHKAHDHKELLTSEQQALLLD